jgi:hypothetical protein
MRNEAQGEQVVQTSKQDYSKGLVTGPTFKQQLLSGIQSVYCRHIIEFPRAFGPADHARETGRENLPPRTTKTVSSRQLLGRICRAAKYLLCQKGPVDAMAVAVHVLALRSLSFFSLPMACHGAHAFQIL